MDPKTRKDWEKSLADQQQLPDYGKVSDFLNGRIQALQVLDSQRQSGSGLGSSMTKTQLRSKVAAFSLTKTETQGTCPICQGRHYLDRCPKVVGIKVGQRIVLARGARLCFNCLRPGHRQSNCTSLARCRQCQSAHHTLLHRNKRMMPSHDEEPSRKRQSLRDEPISDAGITLPQNQSLNPQD